MSVVTQAVADVESSGVGALGEVGALEKVGAHGEAGSGTVVVSRRNEHGMVSAEWAVGLIAAIAIAGVLLAVVTTGNVKEAILNFILTVIRAFTRGL